MRKRAACFLQCLTVWGGFCLLPVASAQAPASAAPASPGKSTPEGPNPGAWVTKVYRFPSYDLVHGFVHRERGQLAAPVLPPATAGDQEFQDFLRKSHDVVTQHLRLDSIVLPKGSIAVYDPRTEILVVRTTNAMHEAVEAVSNHHVGRLAQYLTFSIRILEADGKVVREIIKECLAKSDHASSLARLEGLVARGEARTLEALRLDTRSGQRATISSAANHAYATEYTIDERDQIALAREVRPVGARFEIDPVIGPDNRTIDLNFGLDYHFAPPSKRYEQAGQRGTRSLQVELTDFHTTKVNTAITILSGMTKLLHVWKAEGAPGRPVDPGAPAQADRMQAAFLKGQIVQLATANDNRLEQILRVHGEKVEPTPKTPPAPSVDLPPGMILRTFRIPPDFLSSAGGDPQSAPADPFAPASAMGGVPSGEPRLTVRITALEILRSQGIEFPPGSSANFNAGTGLLIIRNTPANIALIESYVDELARKVPAVIATSVYVVQADAALLRKLEAESSSLADHENSWKTLEAEVAAGRATILRTGWLESRSGQRASIETIDERHYVTGTEVSGGTTSRHDNGGKSDDGKNEKPSVVSSISVSGGGSTDLSPSLDMEPAGFRFEIDPVIGPDGYTVDLNFALNYDFAPPLLRQDPLAVDDKVMRVASDGTDFRRAEITTAITLGSGMTRLLGVWRPRGLPEFDSGNVMQAAFLRTVIVNVEAGTKE